VNKIEDSLGAIKQSIEFINEKYDEIIITEGGVASKQLEHLTNQNKERVAQAELQWKHNQREEDDLGNQLVLEGV
jgi:hypothetical protein